MKKNTAGQVIGIQGVTAASGAAFTGSVTVYVTGDGGTQALGSVASGVCTHEGNGFHTYAPAQAETNYDHVAFTFIGTGMVPATVQVYTDFPQTGDSFARLGAPAGASVSADIAVIDTTADAILVDTAEIGAAGAGLTALASAADLAVVDGVVDAILVDTAEIGVAGAGLTTLATAASIAALNDVAATDIVSAGPITTLAGAVVNVDLVDVCTTNTDMRGTDGANTTVPPTATQIADETLKRDWTAITGEASRSLLNAARFIRNGFSTSGGLLYIKKEDDATTAYTKPVTTDAAAEPITGIGADV